MSARLAAPTTTDGWLGRLVRQSALYTIAGALAKVSGLLLVKLFWNEAYLSVPDFGRLELLNQSAQLLTPLLALGLSSGLLKFLTDQAYAAQHAAVPFTTLAVALACALAGGLVLWAGAEAVGALPFVRLPGYAVRMLAVAVACKAVQTVPLVFLQVRERPLLYSAALLIEFALLIGASYVFLAGYGLGLRGAAYAMALSAAGSTAVLVGGMLWAVRWRFERALVGRLVRFGAPLMLATLSLPFLNVGDRFLLQAMLDDAVAETTIAVYGAAGRVAGVLNVFLVQAFQAAFSVLGLKALGAGAGADLHRRTFRHYAVGAGGFVLGLSLFAYDTLDVLAESDVYLRADAYIFPLALGYFFYGLYIIGVNALYAHGRARSVGAWVLAAAALNAGLNVLLIPVMGAMGSAVATAISYALLAFSAARVTQRLERVRFPWGGLAAVLVLVGALYGLGRTVADATPLVRLGVRAGLLALYPFGVLALRVYTWADVVAGWHTLRARLGW